MSAASLTAWQVWGAPIALGGATAVGLISALLSDGIGDVVSWVALAIPVAVALRCGLRRGRAG